MLVIISGPSGSGKGTVVKELCPNNNFALSISVTTRKPRPNEVHGVDYFFCSIDEFNHLRDTNQLLEHAIFCGNCYGTPKFYVDEQIAKNKFVVLEIDVNGALQVREKFDNCILIFLVPPTLDELARRLITRSTESRETIDERLCRARDEIQLISKYDYLVINDEVNNAVNKVNTIVMSESLKVTRNLDLVDDFLM